MKRAKTSPRSLDTAERRDFVMGLRRTALTYKTIAKLTIAEFGEENLPRGYDDLYASKDVMRELRRLRESITESVTDIRDQEISRLDRMYAVMYRQALQGQQGAVDRCLRIMERRSKYISGLQVPEQLQVSGVGGGPIITEVVIARPDRDNGRDGAEGASQSDNGGEQE